MRQMPIGVEGCEEIRPAVQFTDPFWVEHHLRMPHPHRVLAYWQSDARAAGLIARRDLAVANYLLLLRRGNAANAPISNAQGAGKGTAVSRLGENSIW